MAGLVRHERHPGRGAPDRGHAAARSDRFDRLFEIVDAMVLQGAAAPAAFPATVHPVFGSMPMTIPSPDGFPNQPEMVRVLSPTVRMAGLDAQDPDAELVERPLGIGDHLLRVGRHADGPFERDARLREPADQIIDRLICRLAHRIIERSVQRGAGHVIDRRQVVEQSVDGLDIENSLSDQAGPHTSLTIEIMLA